MRFLESLAKAVFHTEPKPKTPDWPEWVSTYGTEVSFDSGERALLAAFLRSNIHQDWLFRRRRDGVKVSARLPREDRFNRVSRTYHPNEEEYERMDKLYGMFAGIVESRGDRSIIGSSDLSNFGFIISRPHPRWIQVESCMVIPPTV